MTCKMHLHKYNQSYESSVIAGANTIVRESAVMIEILHAAVTLDTVFAFAAYYALTGLAVLTVAFRGDAMFSWIQHRFIRRITH